MNTKKNDSLIVPSLTNGITQAGVIYELSDKLNFITAPGKPPEQDYLEIHVDLKTIDSQVQNGESQ